jgi:predicted MFS family arabinose efflux permease
MRLSFTNPWWVVVGAVGGLIVCNGPVLGFTFGVFLKPIMADMGWQRGTASFALSFGGICSALTVPVLGRMMDRWSIRRVALPGLVIYAIAMGLLGLSPKSLVIFTLLFALAEAASAVQTPIGYAKAISAWSTAGAGWRSALRCRGSGWAASSCRNSLRC